MEGDQIWSPFQIKDAAKMLNVSKTTVIEAKKVLKDGTPDEITAIESGEVAGTTVSSRRMFGQRQLFQTLK